MGAGGGTFPWHVGVIFGWLLPCLFVQEPDEGARTSHHPPSPGQGCDRIILQGAGFTHSGHYFQGFDLLPVYPKKADIYLIRVVVLTVYSRKHCMLTEDICFQAAYAKLQ